MPMTADQREDRIYEGRDERDMDVDRMVNEGLGGGQVTLNNGLITETTTDAMEEDHP
jgi:ethanolamine utilization microcompartment shell protein EutS